MYIVADIGGTKTRIARSRDLTTFDTPAIVNTPQEYNDGLEVFRTTVLELAGNEKIDAVAVGIASPLSADKRSTFNTPHMHWGGRALAEDLEVALSSTVHLENDCALVGLGEAVVGAGSKASIVAYVTVSTGVGGCRIVDGIVDRSAEGFEPGGQYMGVEEPLHTLEELVSGTAVQSIYGVHPKDLGKDNPLWEELAGIFAVGLHNTILHWSPNTVVLGGSMFNEVGISVHSVQEHVMKLTKKFSLVPEIVHSALGDVGGLYGGMDLLKQRKG